MQKIIARLFGGMELRDAQGRELIIGTRKTRALLAYLLLESGRWHARERLAGLLWGDRSETQARNSLNQALYEIGKIETAVGHCIMDRESERLRFRAGSVDCDAHGFEPLVARDPMAAAELCTGTLLEGLDLAERQFTDWLEQKRTQFRDVLAVGLRKLASTADRQLGFEARIGAARQLIALNPFDEAARRLLMRLLADSGNRAEAIRQYGICADLLREELDIHPDRETQDVLAEIRRSHGRSGPNAAAAPDVRQGLVDMGRSENRPIVAVLPFANLSEDADFAYLADGLADDLIFSLSSFRWFRVLARGATFTVRDADRNPSEIRQMFGATHLVTGRVRRAGMRLRVNVDLVDCNSAEQLWGGRYDTPLEDLFNVQDDITRRVVAGLEPALEDSEMRRTLGRPPPSLGAYELFHLGYWHIYKGTAQDDEEARRCFEAALTKDSTYAGAMAGLSHVKYREAHADPVGNYIQRMEDCRDTAARALELDPRDPRALRYFGGASCFLGDQETALSSVSRSIELCPSYASAYSGLAFVHDFKGNFSDATPAADETIRLRPHDPVLHKCIISKAIAHYQTGEYERAERIARDSLRTNSSWWLSNMMLAVSLGQRGCIGDAGSAAERIRTEQPGITLEIMLQRMPFAQSAHVDHLAEGLVRAGWRD